MTRHPDPSRARQSAVDLSRLARELAKLSRDEEQRVAEEGIGDESWPRY
jgi:hypothetical protein